MSKIIKYVIGLLVIVSCFPVQGKAAESWENIEAGLDMASFSLDEGHNTRIVALRFDPSYFEFSLFSISSNNEAPQTILQWALQNDLVAAINASMYLPDGKTSTGYMRMGKHYNNNHIAKNFGAFFLSNPYDTSLPSVKLVDRDTEGWEELLEKYSIVVQNYRLINSKGEVLWSAGGQEHSIAAVAEDDAGNILFLHCREPIKAHSFASAILTLPLNVKTVMYVEGGVQAGLALRTAKEDILFGGRHPSDIFIGSVSVALPNVIGALRRQNHKE